MSLSIKAVTEDDVRPGGRPGECFYCQQAVGGTHAVSCVSVRRIVRLRVTIDFEADVPQVWDKHAIEFSRNESSYCQSSFIDELQRMDEATGCLCGKMRFEYLGDA